MKRPGYVKALQLQLNNSLIQQNINNIDKKVRPRKNTTDLLIVQEIGHAPQIRSEKIIVPVLTNFSYRLAQCLNGIPIFYPVLQRDLNNQTSYQFNLDGKLTSPFPMVNVDTMAARSLHDEKTRITLRNIASTVHNIPVFQVMCAKVEAKYSLFGGYVADTIPLTLEKANERNWNILPSKININRINLKYGVHNFDITINGIKHTKQFNLNQPYQVFVYRVISNKVYFKTESKT